MCGLPSFSSAEFARALKKLGCRPCDRHASGSHEEWERRINGSTVRRPIVLAKKDFSHKTALRLIKAFKITKDQFREAL